MELVFVCCQKGKLNSDDILGDYRTSDLKDVQVFLSYISATNQTLNE